MKSAPVKYVVAGSAVLAAALTWLPRRDPVPEPKSECLPAVSEMLALRHLAKGRLAQEVGDGRRSLWEAAALSAALDRLSPEAAEPPTAPGEAISDEERLCRRVIVTVECLTATPARAVVVARLEAELRAARDRPEGLRLPAVDAQQVRKLLAEARERLAQWRWGRDAGSAAAPAKPE